MRGDEVFEKWGTIGYTNFDPDLERGKCATGEREFMIETLFEARKKKPEKSSNPNSAQIRRPMDLKVMTGQVFAFRY